MIGRDACYMHGGPTPRGHALPQTTHGRYSKSVPTRLAAEYDRARHDPELLSLREETALISSQIHDALTRMERGETGALWLELRETWTEMRAATDPGKAAALLNDIGRLIQRGASDAAANRELRDVIASKARVAESERKRLVEAHQVISVERLMALVGALSSAIIEEVADVDGRSRILTRFERLLSGGAEE